MKIGSSKFFYSFVLLSGSAMANGDNLQDVCTQSLIYTISTQVAGNPLDNDARSLNVAGAFSSGKWLGIDEKTTERMINMKSKDAKSRDFAIRYQKDQKFADSFRSSFIAACHKNPAAYKMN
ncbi:hypothetical protein V461_21580 [Pantoea ananatis BRT98]|uniref:hypothetical protein n=1 Tax=Pantoea ananas TaxID=553 RepID=UPI001EE4FA7D|nr:hypothetical protein [Pantoea ananatis]PKC39242.1 hypothetical protein V461_21580 [Pantoea ananatis BRT98]